MLTRPQPYEAEAVIWGEGQIFRPWGQGQIQGQVHEVAEVWKPKKLMVY